MTRSAMQLDTYREGGNMDRLNIVRDDKGRSFSTSTPFVHSSDFSKNVRSMSVSVISADDSGLGISISDSCSTSFAEISQTTPVVIDSFCTTPKISFNTPQTTCKRTHEAPSSPVSRWSFFARRSLDSSFGDDHEDTVDLNNASLNSNRSSCARRLNLDLDLEAESDEDLCNDTGFHQPTIHTSDLIPQQPASPCSLTDFTPNFSESLLVEQFNDILLKFSPQECDRLIGRKMGQEKVDIIGELDQRNVMCLSLILSYLEPEDLCRMCSVSQQWKSVCNNDIPARRKRKKYAREKKSYLEEMGKENTSKKPAEPHSRSVTTTSNGVLQSLATVQLVSDTPVCPEPLKKQRTTADLFLVEASKLKNDEILQKCPRCCKPAKVSPVQEHGRCQNPDCSYEYCIKCMHKFHGSKDCVPISSKRTKTDSIGSKKSKKNLKRL